MSEISIGDKLRFKKFDWVIVRKKRAPCGVVYYYRVYRKYFFNHKIPLEYTKQSYIIFDWRWNYLKAQLAKDADYHYTKHLWSNQTRR